MDYATAPTNFLANAVLSGSKQLTELPAFRRSAVVARAQQIADARIAKAKAEAAALREKTKKEKKNAGKK